MLQACHHQVEVTAYGMPVRLIAEAVAVVVDRTPCDDHDYLFRLVMSAEGVYLDALRQMVMKARKSKH